MMISNCNITLYNRYYENNIIKYKKCYIYDVNWQGKQAITVSDKGLNSADLTKIYIPFEYKSEDIYLKPKDFEKLQNKEGFFTIQNKDIVVKGIVDFELTGVRPNNLEYLQHLYDNVAIIDSVIANDNGSSYMQHWEVGCK